MTTVACCPCGHQISAKSLRALEDAMAAHNMWHVELQRQIEMRILALSEHEVDHRRLRAI